MFLRALTALHSMSRLRAILFMASAEMDRRDTAIEREILRLAGFHARRFPLVIEMRETEFCTTIENDGEFADLIQRTRRKVAILSGSEGGAGTRKLSVREALAHALMAFEAAKAGILKRSS